MTKKSKKSKKSTQKKAKRARKKYDKFINAASTQPAAAGTSSTPTAYELALKAVSSSKSGLHTMYQRRMYYIEQIDEYTRELRSLEAMIMNEQSELAKRTAKLLETPYE